MWGVGTGGFEAGKIGGRRVREVGILKVLNISQSKRAKGRKPRKMGRESRKQSTGRTPTVPLPSRFSKSVIRVTLSSCTRLKEKLARMLDVRKEC